MGTNGDITDEFDDDSLKQSIESANQAGQWKDDGATFADPKLRDIATKLATVPSESYTERRLRELQERTARKEKKTGEKATPAAGTPFAPEPRFTEPTAPTEPPPPPTNWRETFVRVESPATPTSVSASPYHGSSAS